MSSSTAYRSHLILAVAVVVGALCASLFISAMSCRAEAAQATTGTIIGSVLTISGAPVANAQVTVASASGHYTVRTDARGRFTLLGVTPDTYVLSVEAAGFADVTQTGMTVLADQSERLTVRLAPIKTIGTVRTSTNTFSIGSPSDTFTVSGDAARALSPVENASGLANYLAGTVQGAIASTPGVDIDAFGNAILRGGKVSDTVFDYDSVPVPQGLIAEPGGNIVGAQLLTTGIGATTVTLAGYGTQGDNALGGIVDQIPLVGTYPGKTTIDLTDGIGALAQRVAVQSQWATPDLRWRYALSSTFGDQYFSYGDGTTFYPSEAATYGLALQSRGESSTAANVHFALTPKDDLSFVGLFGQASYQQYGSPYTGETIGAFDGQNTLFPGETNPNAPVTFASGVQGTYDVLKLQWLHTSAHTLTRVQIYQTQFGSTAGGPFWDDLSFPDGVISLAAKQGGRENGVSYDLHDIASDHHEINVGAEFRTNTSFLTQIVPTADEFITSNPTLLSYLAYAGDTWNLSHRFDLTGTARFTSTTILPSAGSEYRVAAIDPHLSAVYHLGSVYALRATYDHTTIAPEPLEADRTDVIAGANSTPFVPLAPETTRNFTYSFEGGGRTQFRATYYANHEDNLIDVLPFNFRSAIASGQSPNGVGVPTNAGELIAHGVDLWLKNGGFTFDTNIIRGSSSSASQFAFNDLNAAASALGHLFPLGYVPTVTSTLAYEFVASHHRLRIKPSISFESGYPYGNGKDVFIFNPATGKPEEVPNDNFVNPGFNYYFLQNPSLPFNATTNPYIGSLGTPEGNNPNTLTTPPQILVSLHIERDLAPRLTVVADVTNLLGVTTPTALQGNPYLIGPPGYAGGNALYGAAYQNAGGFPQPYVLGNGVPTNNGVTQAVPWSYGRGGYVPQGYPFARTVWVSLRYQL